MNMQKNMNEKIDPTKIVRIIIQLIFLIGMPSAFTAAFSGVKTLFTQLGLGEPLALHGFLAVLVALLAYTVVFGRFFCGYACFFGTLGDWIHEAYLLLSRKLKFKPHQIDPRAGLVLSWIKYLILAGVCILCYLGIWGNTHGMSPWEVFSMISAGRFDLDGYAYGILFFVIILFGMAFTERFFCRFLCPMGAVFSLMPVLPFFSLHKNKEKCVKGCRACTRTCPSDIDLPDVGRIEVNGDCFQCQRCIGSCTVRKINRKKDPKARGNICCGITSIAGDELWFTLLRAAILFALMAFMGVS